MLSTKMAHRYQTSDLFSQDRMVKSGFSLNKNVGVTQLSHLLLPLLLAKTI